MSGAEPGPVVPDREAMAADVAAGRAAIQWPVCPKCGREAREWSFDAGWVEDRTELAPVWDGGPLMPVPLVAPRLRHVPEGDRFTLECGHDVPQEVVVVTVTYR